MTYNWMQYPAHVEPIIVGGGGEIIYEDKWHQGWSEPKRFKINPRLAIALIASGAFMVPNTQPEASTPDRWFAPLSEPVRLKKGLKTPLQQFFVYPYPNYFPEFPSEDKWHQPWSEPKRFKRSVPAPAQPVHVAPFNPTVSFGWNYPYTDPVRVKRRLTTGSQLVHVAPYNPTVSFGWNYPYTDPVRKKPRLITGAQQFYAAPLNPTVSFSWFGNLSDPKRFKKGLAAYEQQSVAFVPITPPLPPGPGQRKPLFLNGTLGYTGSSYWTGKPPYGRR